MLPSLGDHSSHTASCKADHRITPIRALQSNSSTQHFLRQGPGKNPFQEMARVTGLEPAASGVTGRRSNQLSYTR